MFDLPKVTGTLPNHSVESVSSGNRGLVSGLAKGRGLSASMGWGERLGFELPCDPSLLQLQPQVHGTPMGKTTMLRPETLSDASQQNPGSFR